MSISPKMRTFCFEEKERLDIELRSISLSSWGITSERELTEFPDRNDPKSDPDTMNISRSVEGRVSLSLAMNRCSLSGKGLPIIDSKHTDTSAVAGAATFFYLLLSSFSSIVGGRWRSWLSSKGRKNRSCWLSWNALITFGRSPPHPPHPTECE